MRNIKNGELIYLLEVFWSTSQVKQILKEENGQMQDFFCSSFSHPQSFLWLGTSCLFLSLMERIKTSGFQKSVKKTQIWSLDRNCIFWNSTLNSQSASAKWFIPEKWTIILFPLKGKVQPFLKKWECVLWKRKQRFLITTDLGTSFVLYRAFCSYHP